MRPARRKALPTIEAAVADIVESGMDRLDCNRLVLTVIETGNQTVAPAAAEGLEALRDQARQRNPLSPLRSNDAFRAGEGLQPAGERKSPSRSSLRSKCRVVMPGASLTVVLPWHGSPDAEPCAVSCVRRHHAAAMVVLALPSSAAMASSMVRA